MNLIRKLRTSLTFCLWSITWQTNDSVIAGIFSRSMRIFLRRPISIFIIEREVKAWACDLCRSVDISIECDPLKTPPIDESLDCLR